MLLLPKDSTPVNAPKGQIVSYLRMTVSRDMKTLALFITLSTFPLGYPITLAFSNAAANLGFSDGSGDGGPGEPGVERSAIRISYRTHDRVLNALYYE